MAQSKPWHDKDLARSDKHRLREAARDRVQKETIRNIGRIPDIVDIARRESCREDLALFIMTYGGEGKSPFSPDHIRVIKRIERAVMSGGRFVEAVYRGFGKSTISRMAVVWSLLYGYRQYIPIVGNAARHAEENMDAIKGIFASELIAADFPDVAVPILKLEGITQRAHGQIYEDKDGVPQSTHMEWGSEFLVLPLTDGANDASGEFHPNKAGGACICSCGITSKTLQGMNHRRGDGIELRPDLAVIDDPQDQESAHSPDQVRKRLNIIKKSILKSAGHAKGMAVIMPCTVMAKDDVIEQLLDPQKNPAWQGERIPFVSSWSDCHDTLWMDEYRRIKTTYNRDDPDDYLRARGDATEFYKANQPAMDAGCCVSWPHAFSVSEDEVSAIQHAYNALIDDGEEVFASEFQNQPFLPPEEEGQLTRGEIENRINALSRYEVPMACEKLTAFIDVQGKCLYYVVTAWTPEFTGHIVDYGVFPDQHKHAFTLRQVTTTLQDAFPGTGQEGAWRKGFEALAGILLQREYRRDDGAVMRLSRMLIDANDGSAMQTVFDFCRQSQFGNVCMPSRGKGVTASGTPFCDYKKKPGDKVSDMNWRIPSPQGRGATRFVYYDVNFWKSFVRARFRTPMGDAGCLSIFGQVQQQGKPGPTKLTHEMFIDHMVSEYSVRTEGRGRTVDEWAMRPNVADNHFWDCLVGCAVAASEQGCRIIDGGGGGAYKPRKAFSMADARAKRRR